jgi:triosephosphate isomerase
MIIASNFKMNHTRKSTKEFLDKLKELKTNHTIRVFPPATTLCENEIVGAQNGYPAEKGSFTGEIGLEQIQEFNIDKILIGHSERRNILEESQELIAKKFEFYKEQNFEITYCIGEPLEIRQKGIDEVIKYLKSQLVGIDINYDKLIVAYEPVWAIGTGVSATIEEIEETHNKLREFIKTPLLYGGSVKLENISAICEIENVDGALIGTASWQVENFIKMINQVKG